MRIILADHHSDALWALQVMLSEEPDIDLVADTEDGESLLVLAKEHQADLYLIERELPGPYLETVIDSLHRLLPRPVVIVMSSKSEESRRTLVAGADVFLSKDIDPEWLLATLRRHAPRQKG